MEQLIHRAKELLPQVRIESLSELADSWPDERAWEYALERLEMSDYPNLVYFRKCLEGGANHSKPTTRQRGRARLNLTRCPFSPDLICPGPANRRPEPCRGEDDCLKSESVKRWIFGKGNIV